MPTIQEHFDGEFTRRFNEAEVAVNWFPWHREGDGHFRPEWKRAGNESNGPVRARSGSAQQWFKWSAKHDAGVYRIISTYPGALVSVQGYAMAWTSGEDDPSRNGTPFTRTAGSYYTQLGIDPLGGTNWNSLRILWSEAKKHGPHEGDVKANEWWKHVVQAIATSHLITVFLRGWTEWGLKNENCYWDDVAISWTEPTGEIDVSAEVAQLEAAHANLMAAVNTESQQIQLLKMKLGL